MTSTPLAPSLRGYFKGNKELIIKVPKYHQIFILFSVFCLKYPFPLLNKFEVAYRPQKIIIGLRMPIQVINGIYIRKLQQNLFIHNEMSRVLREPISIIIFICQVPQPPLLDHTLDSYVDRNMKFCGRRLCMIYLNICINTNILQHHISMYSIIH